MNPHDTRDLLAEADAGSLEALDVLFGRALPRLRRLLTLRASKALLSRMQVEDLVQEAYTEAVRQFPTYSYRGTDSFFRWLAAIAIGRMNNLRRLTQAEKRTVAREQRLRGPQSVADHGGISDIVDPGPGPRTLTSGSEDSRRIDAAMANLAPNDREVILLARIEGLPLLQVAKQIGRTQNATALLLSRALRKLKKLMEN